MSSRTFLAGLLLAGLAMAGEVPRRSPEFQFNTLSGAPTLLSRARAGKVVAVEFFITTCPHCQECADFMEQQYKELGSRGFEPIFIATNQPPPGQTWAGMLQAFIREHHMTFPVGYTDKPDEAKDYTQISIMAPMYVPHIVLIDPSGTIQFEHVGFEKKDGPVIRAKIEELLNKRTKAPAKVTTSAKKS